jgi:ABC-type glycerol-3-phosphate transport system substrate-binding protein
MTSPRIDPSQPLPVYVQLKTLLTEEIISGRYAPGEQLPTEHELCARYGISRTPVHRALAELAEEGAILRHRRRGTFVNPHWVSQHGNPDELRVVVPEGPWEELVREACPAGTTLSVAAVALDELHQVLIHAVAEGRAPDVAVLDSVWVREFASSGFLLPLDGVLPDWPDEEYLADVLVPFRAANEYDGRPVAVQAEADVLGLWYDRDLLRAAGVALPRTWAELRRTGKALQARGVPHPLVMPAGSRGGEATTYCLLGLLATNGVEVFGNQGVTVDQPGTVECLALLRDLVSEGVLSVDAVAFERDRAIRLLAQGNAALAVGGSYEMEHLAAGAGIPTDQVWERFGFAGPPVGPRGGATTLVGGMVHAVFRQAGNPRGAVRLLRALSTTDALASMSRRTGQLASRRSAADMAARGSEFLELTGALLDGAVVRPGTATYPRVSAQLQSMVESVVVGRLEPAVAAGHTSDLICAITGMPGKELPESR